MQKKDIKGIIKKVRIRHILVLEMAVLIVLMTAFAINKQGAPESLNMGVTVTDFSSNYAVYDNGWHVTAESFEGDSDTIDMLYGPFISLPKGDYTVVIDYKCDEKQSARPYSAGRNISFIKANTIELDPHYCSLSYDIRITEPVDDFEVRVYYDGQGDLTINDLKIYKNLNSWKRAFLIIALLFILADICIINYRVVLQNKMQIIYLFLIILLISLPLFVYGVGYGLDTDFHLMRVEGISKELRRGVFPVRLQSDWLYGNGYPASIYYGDLLLYFPAIMRLFGFTVTQAYKSYILIINILTVCISYFSFKIIVNNKNISILMTLVYCTNTYRLMTVVFRDALGEYTATAFLPMVAASVFLIYTDDRNRKKPDIQKASILAIAMTGIVLSHTLSTEMVTVVLFAFCIMNISRTIRPRILLTFLVAVIETVLLSLYYLVPFMDYYINVDVASTHGVKDNILQIQDSGASILDLFLFYKNTFFGSWNMTPGAVLMSTLIFAMLLLAAGKGDRRIRLMVIMSIIVLFLSTNLFPWNWLASHFRFWNALSVVEFPHRYLTLSGVLLTILMGFLLLYFWDSSTGRFKINVIAVIVLLSLTGSLVLYHYYEKYIITYNCIDSVDVRTDVLLGGDFSRVDKNGEPIKYIRAEIETEEAEAEIVSHDGAIMEIRVKTEDTPGLVKTPYNNYKGYKVIDSNGYTYEIEDDEYCKVSFVVPSKFEGVIKIVFIEPWYWKVSDIISISAWIGLIGFWTFHCFEKRRRSLPA